MKDKLTILSKEFPIKAELTWIVTFSPSPLHFYDGKINVIEGKKILESISRFWYIMKIIGT